MKLLYKLVTIAALGASLTFAQDSSGNGMLNGSYRFRYVAPVNYSAAGNVSEVIAAEGVITFNGAGAYTIAAGSQFIDNTQNSGKPQTFPANAGGSYVIGSAGLGYISSPIGSITTLPYSFSSVPEFGSFSRGVFTGSATESQLNDMFVVMLVGTAPTNSSFTSPYWLGVMDFSGGTDLLLKNALVEIAPNGSGALGPLTITGLANNFQPGTLLTQTVTGATYNFATDGGATLTLPLPTGIATANALFTGSRLMYVSSDGNFVLGWNPNGYDIFFGVRALTTAATDSLFKGLYFIGNLSDVPQQCGAESYWGSQNSDGMEHEIIHQRLFSPACTVTGAVTDFGTDDYQTSAIASDGTVPDILGNYYAFGASGNGFVSVSNSGGFYSLTIGIHAPAFSGSGVYLNPIGMVNAANWDPITAGVAPGELITLFGSGLASTPKTNIGGQPFGNSLGTTQVLVNGQPSPIYYVSPTQVSAIIPYATASSTAYTAEVQVNNGGLLSNQISVYLTDADSGIFSQGQDGIGDAFALHLNGSLVNAASPAAPGETIFLALTGMGSVTPTITDGALGPANPPGFSYANNFSTPNQLLALFNDYINNKTGQQATIVFAGLYPGLAGLYQMNVTVPTTVGPGEVYIEVVTDNADVEQVTVCVTSCSASTSTTAAQARLRQPAGAAAGRNQKAPPHITNPTGRVRSAGPILPSSSSRRPVLPPPPTVPQN
jgi:uncharacterized protein (TIGR03437 family)